MKIRTDFVTNSSSSSFVISKKNLSETQLKLIRNYKKVALALRKINYNLRYELKIEDKDIIPVLTECYKYFDKDPWDIKENGSYIAGATLMDNFDMEAFLQFIDVDNEDIIWGDGGIDGIGDSEDTP